MSARAQPGCPTGCGLFDATTHVWPRRGGGHKGAAGFIKKDMLSKEHHPWWKHVVDQVRIMVDEQRNSRPNESMTQQSPSPVPSQGSDPSATLSAWSPPAAAAPAEALSPMAQLLVITIVIGGLILLALEAWGGHALRPAHSQQSTVDSSPDLSSSIAKENAPAPPDNFAASNVSPEAKAEQVAAAANIQSQMPATGKSMAASRPGARTMMDATMMSSYVNVQSSDVDADFEFVGRA